MKTWEKIELECFEYIRDTYTMASFEHKGFSNSNTPDIVAKLHNGETFNIEVKSATAQCGQFVLLVKNDQFVFSNENGSLEEFSTPFVEYMNQHFDDFKIPGTAGKEIDLDTEILAQWIEQYYALKGTRFFATKYRNNVVIFPINRIKDYFEIKCTYRIKKSGSRNVPKKCARAISIALGKDYYYDDKYFILKDLSLKEKEIVKCHDCEFYVSEKRDDGYKITVLSETRNANVIFKVKAKKAQDREDLELFEKALMGE